MENRSAKRGDHHVETYRRVADEIAAKIGESPETVLKVLIVAAKQGLLRKVDDEEVPLEG